MAPTALRLRTSGSDCSHFLPPSSAGCHGPTPRVKVMGWRPPAPSCIWMTGAPSVPPHNATTHASPSAPWWGFSVSKGDPAQPQVDDITDTLVGGMQSRCKSNGVQVMRGVCLHAGKTWILAVYLRVLVYVIFAIKCIICSTFLFRTTAVV